jgi:hypothetical protein
MPSNSPHITQPTGADESAVFGGKRIRRQSQDLKNMLHKFGEKNDKEDYTKSIVRSEEGTHDGIYLNLLRILTFLFDMNGTAYQESNKATRAIRTDVYVKIGSDRNFKEDDKRKSRFDYIEISKVTARRAGRPTLKRAANLTL